MINSTATIKKTNKSNGTNGIKALIMASSLAVTIGGWGLLAAGQLQNTVTTLTQSQISVQPVNSAVTTNAQNLRQVTVSNTQPRAVTRTRSSR